MRIPIPTSRLLTAAALGLAAGAAYGQVTVVNMIPNTLSNEVQRDSEPSVAVNPANPLRIAASAFTPDPGGSGSGPIFVSTNGGNAWVLNVVLPGGNKTGDTSIRFGGSSGVLYAGILRSDASLRMNILRKTDFTTAGLMDVLVTRDSEDQPWVEATTSHGGTGSAVDRVFVGNNNFAVATSPRRSASVDRSQDVATAPAPAGLATAAIEARSTGTANQDGPAIRTAHHPDGTVYAVFYGWTAASGSTKTTDIVVVRDDAWGAGATPFSTLTDGGDGLAGVRVVTGRTVVFNQLLGNQRTGGQCSIAVDPNNSDHVYVAWCDGTPTYTLHLRRSTDRGVTWSASDLRTISGATNPGLAVTTAGTVGLLYQQLVNPGTGNRWQTHLERSSTGFTTAPSDLTLANVPDSLGGYVGPNPIGDYANLTVVGKNFYGAFSAFNTADNANFPNGVTYLRNADFTTHHLLGTDGTTVVADSIDPFFFKVQEGPSPADDFYVRDWTDGPGSGDNGAEPSTHAVFYQTSDVWNRRGTLPGTFPSDQPENEDAGNGMGNIGDNWAFTRIRRNVLPVSGSKTVLTHFMVSKLGVGSSYVDGSLDPHVSFIDPDPSVTFTAADLGPATTPAMKWHLNAIASTHLCMAAEIATPGDPFVAPSLLGRAPGWPTTDLAVIYDNNKAQRNLGLSTTPARGVGMADTFYAIAHNAATFTRTMVIRYQVDPLVWRRLKGAHLELPGGRTDQRLPLRPEGVLHLANMAPGENRWIGVSLPATEGKEGELLPVTFFEMVGGQAVNGFAIAAKPSPMAEVVKGVAEAHRSIFTRVAAFADSATAKAEAESAETLLKEQDGTRAYLAFVKTHLKSMTAALKAVPMKEDPFGVAVALKALAASLGTGRAEAVVMSHKALLNKEDAHLTRLLLQKGDPADILLVVCWNRDLLRRAPKLAQLKTTKASLARMETFIEGVGARKVGAKDYPELLHGLRQSFEESAKVFRRELPGLAERIPPEALDDPTILQKAHRAFLLELQKLEPARPKLPH